MPKASFVTLDVLEREADVIGAVREQQRGDKVADAINQHSGDRPIEHSRDEGRHE